MAIRALSLGHAKRIISRSLSIGREGTSLKTPKGQFAVYIGEQEKKRYMLPKWYLDHPLFRDLLSIAEDVFGFDYPTGGLTILCQEDTFLDLISRMNESS